MEAELVDLLLAIPAVSTAVSDRIFPVVVNRLATLPAVTYARAPGGDTEFSYAGPTWRRAAFTVIAWATDYPDARVLADAIFDALNGHLGSPTAIEVISAVDGNDMWLENMNAFGCMVQITVQKGV